MYNKIISALILFFLLAILFAGIFSCTKDNIAPSLSRPGNCDSMEYSYQSDIVPLVVAYCNGTTCHTTGEGNYDFSTYGGLADRIRSGRLEERLLLSTDNPLHMPKGFEMDSCDLYHFRVWIRQGFQNN